MHSHKHCGFGLFLLAALELGVPGVHGMITVASQNSGLLFVSSCVKIRTFWGVCWEPRLWDPIGAWPELLFPILEEFT